MKDEDLDRLLAGAPLPEPGPAFTWAVMAQVRREALAPPPLAFPWRRLALGLSLSLALAVALLVARPPAPDPGIAASAIPQVLIEAAWARHLALAAAVLLVSWLSLRVTAIFSGARA